LKIVWNNVKLKKPQGKLLRCTQGEVLDIILDIRKGSPTFGQHITIILSDQNKNQIWIPPGLAHGFAVLSPIAQIQYKVTDFYDPNDEGGVIWNDPGLGIDWQIDCPIISGKDALLPCFNDAAPNFPSWSPLKS